MSDLKTQITEMQIRNVGCIEEALKHFKIKKTNFSFDKIREELLKTLDEKYLIDYKIVLDFINIKKPTMHVIYGNRYASDMLIKETDTYTAIEFISAKTMNIIPPDAQNIVMKIAKNPPLYGKEQYCYTFYVQHLGNSIINLIKNNIMVNF